MPRATKLIIAAAVAGGALTLLVAAWRQPASAHLGVSQWVVAVTMGVLVLGSWVWPVVVFRGGESEAFHLDEGFFVILALLVPPLLTLGTLAAATILGQAAKRRAAVKSAFNSGQMLIAAGSALAVSRVIAAPANPLTAQEVAAVLVGVAAYLLINSFLVSSIMVTMGSTWADFYNDLPVRISLTGAGALTGVVLALALHGQLWAVVLRRARHGARAPADQRAVRRAVRPHPGSRDCTRSRWQANRGLLQQAVPERFWAPCASSCTARRRF